MYYECDGCGGMMQTVSERASFVRECPACGEPTRWSPAFEGEGVSF